MRGRGPRLVAVAAATGDRFRCERPLHTELKFGVLFGTLNSNRVVAKKYSQLRLDFNVLARIE